MAASQSLMSDVAKKAFVNSSDACPFCGSPRAALQEIDLDSWMTECLDCHATGPVKPSAMAAEQAWNCRISYP
jgi:Lar family restriction alleviation protein